jgi:hypothetical protein
MIKKNWMHVSHQDYKAKIWLSGQQVQHCTGNMY